MVTKACWGSESLTVHHSTSLLGVKMVGEGLWDKIIISKLRQCVCVMLRASSEHFSCCVVQSVLKGGSKPFFSAELVLSSMPSINLVFYYLNWFIIVSQIKLNKWFNEFRYYDGWVTVLCFTDYFLSVQFSKEKEQPTYSTVPVGFHILSHSTIFLLHIP